MISEHECTSASGRWGNPCSPLFYDPSTCGIRRDPPRAHNLRRVDHGPARNGRWHVTDGLSAGQRHGTRVPPRRRSFVAMLSNLSHESLRSDVNAPPALFVKSGVGRWLESVQNRTLNPRRRRPASRWGGGRWFRRLSEAVQTNRALQVFFILSQSSGPCMAGRVGPRHRRRMERDPGLGPIMERWWGNLGGGPRQKAVKGIFFCFFTVE